MSRILCLYLLAVSLTATGCGSKLKMEETIDSLPPVGKVYEIDPIKSEQKVKIVIKTTEAPVDFYAYTGQNQAAVERDLFGRGAELCLARERKSENIDVVVTVPANEKLIVNIQRAASKAPKDVSIKITN